MARGKIIIGLKLIIFMFVPLCGNWSLYAGDHDYGHWGEYGINAKISDRWYFKSDILYRLKDNAGDFHYFRWESGPGVKFHKNFSFLVMYRLNPQEKNEDWKNEHYLMVDPALTLYKSAAWTLNFRSRFQVKMGDLGRGFWRPRPQLSRSFKLGSQKASWFVNNEFFFQITELGDRDRYNQNRFASGFKFQLGSILSLSTYYLLRSDKITGTDEWKHLHVLGTALYAAF